MSEDDSEYSFSGSEDTLSDEFNPDRRQQHEPRTKLSTDSKRSEEPPLDESLENLLPKGEPKNVKNETPDVMVFTPDNNGNEKIKGMLITTEKRAVYPPPNPLLTGSPTHPIPKVLNQNGDLDPPTIDHPNIDTNTVPSLKETTPLSSGKVHFSPSSLADQEAFKEKMLQTASQMKGYRRPNNNSAFLNPHPMAPTGVAAIATTTAANPGLESALVNTTGALATDPAALLTQNQKRKWHLRQQQTHQRQSQRPQSDEESLDKEETSRKKIKKFEKHAEEQRNLEEEGLVGLVQFQQQQQTTTSPPLQPPISPHPPQPSPQLGFNITKTTTSPPPNAPPQPPPLPPNVNLNLNLLPGGPGSRSANRPWPQSGSLPPSFSSFAALQTANAASMHHHHQQQLQQQQQQQQRSPVLSPRSLPLPLPSHRQFSNLRRPPPPPPPPLQLQQLQLQQNSPTELIVANIDKVLRAASEQSVLHHQLAVATDNLTRQLQQLRGALNGLVTGVAGGFGTSPSPRYNVPIAPSPQVQLQQQLQQQQQLPISPIVGGAQRSPLAGSGGQGNLVGNNIMSPSIQTSRDASIGPLLDFLLSR